ncbi:MAG: preprotein translocase subunit SecE [Solirubrobacteraceae bacterium]
MARDRQRAKQRRARRRETVPPGGPRAGRDDAARVDHPGHDDRSDQPNSAPDPLAHSSAELDEAEHQLEAGAAAAALPGPEIAPGDAGDGDDEDAYEAAEEALGGEGSGDGGRRNRPVADGALPARRGPRPTPAEHKLPLPLRFAGFLRASWAELQRVQWPNRRQVTQATGVVVLFVIIAGAYLGVADWVAQKIVNAIV